LIAPFWLIFARRLISRTATQINQTGRSAQTRQPLEQFDFVRLGIDDPVWNHSTFSK
jgi:hypothetical protein